MRILGDQKGFALISVLWGVAILSLIALALLNETSLSAKLERNSWHQMQIDGALEEATNRAILGLLDRSWPPDGQARTLELGGLRINVSVRDEAGKIDLNAAEEGTLLKLFQSVGLSQSEASRIVDRILDWREPDAQRRVNGGKAADYRAAGSSYAPRNGPFHSLDELSLVLGMTPELFARVKPALTIYSQQQTVQLDRAPPEVLKALGSTPQPTSGGFDITGLTAPGVTLGGHAVSITTRAQTSRGKVGSETVLRITDDPQRPFFILFHSGG